MRLDRSHGVEEGGLNFCLSHQHQQMHLWQMHHWDGTEGKVRKVKNLFRFLEVVHYRSIVSPFTKLRIAARRLYVLLQVSKISASCQYLRLWKSFQIGARFWIESFHILTQSENFPSLAKSWTLDVEGWLRMWKYPPLHWFSSKTQPRLLLVNPSTCGGARWPLHSRSHRAWRWWKISQFVNRQRNLRGYIFILE